MTSSLYCYNNEVNLRTRRFIGLNLSNFDYMIYHSLELAEMSVLILLHGTKELPH